MKLVNDDGLPIPLALFYVGLDDGHHAEVAYEVLHSLLCAAAEAQGFFNAHPNVDLDSAAGFARFQKENVDFATLLLEAQQACVSEGIPPFSISSVFLQGLGFEKAEDVPLLEEIAQRAGDVLRVAIPLSEPPSHMGLAAIFWQGLQAEFVQEASVLNILSILSGQLQERQELFAPVADSLLGAGMIWEVLEEEDEELPVILADFTDFYWPLDDDEKSDFYAEDAMGSDIQKMATPGIVREDGWLYFLTEDGNVARQPKNGGDVEVIAETKVEREPGYMYYLDAAGDVARVLFLVPTDEEI
ncbi:MAG: hypothetical protein GY822_08355 [Deltaproteobacteria bacterium]|nr:hypothetical protein [Deltaproteobacteria bacterium]